jgi:hypothetical protein
MQPDYSGKRQGFRGVFLLRKAEKALDGGKKTAGRVR